MYKGKWPVEGVSSVELADTIDIDKMICFAVIN